MRVWKGSRCRILDSCEVRRSSIAKVCSLGEFLIRGFLILLATVVWFAIWGICAGLGDFLLDRFFLERDQRDGYGALFALWGLILIMPLGLILSGVLGLVLKRVWIFIACAVPVGLATVIIPYLAA